MPKKKRKYEFSWAEARRRAFQSAASRGRLISREVIRDKREEDSYQELSRSLIFSDHEAERSEIASWSRGGYGVIFHPVPYVFGNPIAAHVDWLGFTLTPPDRYGLEWVFEEIRRLTGLGVTKHRSHGWNGYTMSAALGDFGFIAWGGKHQRATIHVEINGTGCGIVEDWAGLAALGNAIDARITRVDLAHDDFLGKVCSIEQVLAWYEAGGFNAGGRSPKLKRAGDWDALTDGRTVYIGTRGNKLLRCYEKGKQLGRTDSTWLRVELELSGKNRVIPWEVLESPGNYLAGAYPCLAFLTATQSKIKTAQNGAKFCVEKMTKEARRLSGKAINVLMDLEKGDASAVVNLLRRDGIPKRLIPYERGLSGYEGDECEPST